MRRRFRFAAFFIRHSRAYLAAHWTVTVALAVVLLSAAPRQAPSVGLKIQARPVIQTSCSGGQVLVHFSETGTTECLKIVGAGF
ncbi:MAG TPA: hypothetical protein VN837_07180 [Chloroflexota bacterium]|nr:hypothetical protein [Chloroflexota bacterium]